MEGEYIYIEIECVVDYTREEFIISVQDDNDDENDSGIDENDPSCLFKHPSFYYS
jgi:hypothetical protein